MTLLEVLLESWDRQCRILTAVSSLVTAETRHLRPSPESWSLDEQLAHIHECRRFWLGQIAPSFGGPLAKADGSGSLEDIQACLEASSRAVRDAVADAVEQGREFKTKNVTYDHPVLFLQHMIWHEGWHVGQILLAFRANGQEVPEEWEEPNVWSHWRTEVWG